MPELIGETCQRDEMMPTNFSSIPELKFVVIILDISPNNLLGSNILIPPWDAVGHLDKAVGQMCIGHRFVDTVVQYQE